MYCSRPIAIRGGGPAFRGHGCRRGMSSFAPAVGRFPSNHGHPFGEWHGPRFGRELAPLFNILDDAFESLTGPTAPWQRSNANNEAPTFQPRFDVKEEENTYELRGELPGVDPKDLEVQFEGEHTLTIRGRTESEATTPEQQESPPAYNDDEKAAEETGSRRSSTSSYVKPTVEDEAEASTSTATPAAGEPEQGATEKTAAASEEQQHQQRDHSQVWMSERRTGKFSRSFNFAGRVDQEGITASLRNGILKVSVPKAKEPEPRRIQVA